MNQRNSVMHQILTSILTVYNVFKYNTFIGLNNGLKLIELGHIVKK